MSKGSDVPHFYHVFILPNRRAPTEAAFPAAPDSAGTTRRHLFKASMTLSRSGFAGLVEQDKRHRRGHCDLLQKLLRQSKIEGDSVLSKHD
jgi:hypothetical protein